MRLLLTTVRRGVTRIRAESIQDPQKIPVGVSLLAIAVYQPHMSRLIHRYREQAHSYRGSSSFL